MMLELTQKKDRGAPASKSLTLPWERRIKSRQRAVLDDGEEVGIFLPRGTVLRDGDVLVAEEGTAVVIQAAAEPVSSVYTKDSLLLARLCYHLGNRHVALEIGQGRLRYQHDHVLDDMVRALGGLPVKESAPFEPEVGAYAGHGHHHG
jgi:urease accessory protein